MAPNRLPTAQSLTLTQSPTALPASQQPLPPTTHHLTPLITGQPVCREAWSCSPLTFRL